MTASTSDAPADVPLDAPIAVLGAGGRTGRAIAAEATGRGHRVTAIVRDPARHDDLGRRNVTVVAGDALDAASVAKAAVGARALVSAVTPFTAPPASFDGFDTGYYARVADTLDHAARQAGVTRVVVVGLFATLHTPDGGLVLDDPALFPEALRPFARAHAAGIDRLRRTGEELDWIVLSPPPELSAEAPRTGRYGLGDRVLDPERKDRPLCHADLAAAIVGEIDRPTRHREHTAVYSA